VRALWEIFYDHLVQQFQLILFGFRIFYYLKNVLNTEWNKVKTSFLKNRTIHTAQISWIFKYIISHHHQILKLNHIIFDCVCLLFFLLRFNSRQLHLCFNWKNLKHDSFSLKNYAIFLKFQKHLYGGVISNLNFVFKL
jgi:hypothetical protein